MTERQRLDAVRQALVETFGGGGPIAVGAAPGRVNLIGEHTDYNDGFVFPMALGHRLRVAARRRDDRTVRILAMDLGAQVALSLDDPLARDPAHGWSDYPRGVLWALIEAGYTPCGMDMAIHGDVPLGAGLSSSAALEVATAFVARHLAGFEADPKALALLCQRAENDFVGMRCGVMDQFVAAMAREGHALLLDCRSLEVEQVPLDLADARLLVCKSGVKHSLVESAYNRRREECELGVAVLAERFPEVAALRDATLGRLDACRDELSPVVYHRCRHVVTENARTRRGVSALKRGDLAAFGREMNGSHDSLRDAYEVSCEEVDLLVDLAREVPGVLGTRITGGGFGGCTVNLLQADAVDRFHDHVLPAYRERFGITAETWITTAGPGAEVIASG